MFNIKEYIDSDFFEAENKDSKVSDLIKKYDIDVDAGYIYDVTDDYRALVNHIINLYTKEQDIPNDIKIELMGNINLRNYILEISEEKINHLLSDNNTIIYKEIVNIVNLLSFGKNYEIFISYNNYNLTKLEERFKDFENNLNELKENENLFLTTFNLYICFIKTIVKLCVILSIDVHRKNIIENITETIQESINNIKYTIKLKDTHINLLNILLGDLLFNFSHIKYIDTKGKDITYLIEQFNFDLEKLHNGYLIHKKSFEEKNHKLYLSFLNSTSNLLSILIYKIEKEFPDKLEKKELLENSFSLYKKIIEHETIKEIKSIYDFKIILENNFVYIYNKSNKQDYKTDEIIETFIKKDNFTNLDLEIIHSLVLFSSDLEDKILLNLVQKLIDLEKFKNDYYEFYKIKICDVIINKFINKNNFDLPKELIENLIEYIEKNMISSHLITSYSKIYLTLSLYYSFFRNDENIEKSKLLHYKYSAINSDIFLEKEFLNINNQILENYAKNLIDSLKLSIETDIEKYIQLGKRVLEKFYKQEKLNSRNKINEKLSNIITKIFTNENLEAEELNLYIRNFISNDIFYGLTFIDITGLCKEDYIPRDIGYEQISIDLIENYSLKITYSSVYKDIFETIYKENEKYIKQNLINLIIIYLKSAPIYNDKVTNLKNIEKLKKDIEEMKDTDLTIIQLYIKSLIKLNKEYGYIKTNKFFKKLAHKINLKYDAYRENGPIITIVLKDNEKYEEVIEYIENLKIKFENDEISPDLIVTATHGKKEDILENSIESIHLAVAKKNI